MRKVIYIFFLLGNSLYGNVNKNGDTGLWLEQSFQKELSNSSSVFLNIQERWGNNLRTFHLQRYEGILNSTVYNDEASSDKWDIGLGYAFVKFKRGEKWVTENLYLIQSTLSMKWLDGILQQRGRLTYVIPNFPEIHKHITVRYRLLYRTPWELTAFKLTPWISNEFFFRENSFNPKTGRGSVGLFSQNRFRLGFRKEVFKNFSYDFYIQWLSLKQRPLKRRSRNNVFDLGFNTFVSF